MFGFQLTEQRRTQGDHIVTPALDLTHSPSLNHKIWHDRNNMQRTKTARSEFLLRVSEAILHTWIKLKGLFVITQWSSLRDHLQGNSGENKKCSQTIEWVSLSGDTTPDALH